MAYCPNCRAPIAQDAQDCDVCGTSFGPDTWLPLDSLPALHTGRSRRRKTALFAGLVLALGLPALLWWRVGEAALEALAYIVPAIALVAATPCCWRAAGSEPPRTAGAGLPTLAASRIP